MRVFRLRMLAVKDPMKRRAAPEPAAVIIEGSFSKAGTGEASRVYIGAAELFQCTRFRPEPFQTTISVPFLMVYGIIYGMEIRIDKSGRIVVPKPLRERLGLKPNTRLEAIEQPGGMLLRPVEQRPSMTRIDGLWVHLGRAEPGARWDVLEDVRAGRLDSVLKA